MKNLFLLCVLALAVFSACEKDSGKLPIIAFKTGGTYLSADKTVAKGDSVTVGITADKAEDKDVLKTLNQARSYDGAAATTVSNETLTGSQGDHYEKDYGIKTRNQAGTEKYTFTVTNRDGLTNQVSITLTVQ